MTEDYLAKLIAENIPREDFQMHVVIGYFLSCYSIGELGLTNILLALSSATHLGRFAILCKGMDAKSKISRIQELSKEYNGLGPNLEERLDYFSRTIAGKRNRIVHTAVRQVSNAPGRYQFLSHHAAAKADLEFDRLDELGAQTTAMELLGFAKWLNAFALDCEQVMQSLGAGGEAEIATPSKPARAIPVSI